MARIGALDRGGGVSFPADNGSLAPARACRRAPFVALSARRAFPRVDFPSREALTREADRRPNQFRQALPENARIGVRQRLRQFHYGKGRTLWPGRPAHGTRGVRHGRLGDRDTGGQPERSQEGGEGQHSSLAKGSNRNRDASREKSWGERSSCSPGGPGSTKAIPAHCQYSRTEVVMETAELFLTPRAFSGVAAAVWAV